VTWLRCSCNCGPSDGHKDKFTFTANRKEARSLYKKKIYTLEQLKNAVEGKENKKRNKTARSIRQAVR
jgi:hypothetical protein